MIPAFPAFIFGVFIGQARAADAAPSDLTAAKALYASASYEEALTRLSTVRSPEDEDQVEEYRALCYLALGRGPDAERTLERIVNRKPLYIATDAEVSPRLVTMLHEVRRRLLPAAARSIFAKANSDYERQDFKAASAGFADLLSILSDDDTAAASAGLADLKQLGEKFLKLANDELAAAAATPPAATPRPSPAPSTARDGHAVYSVDDLDVTPPDEIERVLPPWAPKDQAIARLEFHGTLEIIVDEHGRVVSAAMRKPTLPAYDTVLLTAAKRWRFKPATKGGAPVRYRKFFDIVLRPTM